MAIRLPLQTVLSATNNDEVGAGSVAGGIPLPFLIPQDAENIVVKFVASTVGGAVSATVQTTDDGGTTWYDVARTSTISAANNTTAQWLNIPITGQGFRSAAQAQTSVAGSTNVTVVLNTAGNTAASALGQSQNSGLPFLSPQGRVFVIVTGNLTSSSILTQVKVNSQSATA